MSVAERKRPGPSGTRAESAIKQARIIELRIAGHTLERIGDELGLTHEGVRYHQQQWLERQQPSAEQTEALRQIQAMQIDALAATLWPQRDDVAVVDRLMKLMDRKARLFGLDLQPGLSLSVTMTAEGLAAALGYDEPAIEGTATEITDGT